MNEGTTEVALLCAFDSSLFAHKPLGTPERLANSDVPFPISFIYGDRDWVDSSYSEVVVKANKFFESGQS